MILTRKGMNSESYDKNLSLKSRYEYSKNLAIWMNQAPIDYLEPLKEVTENYFESLNKRNISDNEVYEIEHKKVETRIKLAKLLLLFPWSILGLIHCGLPYFAVKSFVEKKFKRAVFWGSTKMLFSMICIGLLNIPVIFLFSNFFNVSNWWGLIYYLLIGLFGLGFYLSMTLIKDLIRSSKLKKENVNELINKRNQAMSLLKKIIPSEYL